MAFVNEKDQNGNRQTIDRERNIVLKYEGYTGSGGPIAFILKTTSGDIKFTAVRGDKLSEDQKSEVFWHIKSIFNTGSMSEHNVYSLIKESLDIYGLTGNPDRSGIAAVTVNFENVVR